MINKKSLLAGLLAISAAVIISSCGSAGSSNSGQGGPEVSPEEYTDLGSPVVDTANTAITGTTTPEEGTVVESIVDARIEGSLDTDSGDTGLDDAEEILNGAVSDVVIAAVADSVTSDGTANTSTDAASTTETTDSSDTASNTGTTPSADTGSTSGTTTSTDSGSTSGTTASSDAGSTSETTASTDTGSTSGTSESTGAGSTTGTSVSTDTGSTTDTTASTEPATSDVPVISGDVVDALNNDEAVSQNELEYSLDSSQGRWYEETKKELFSEADAAAIKAQIQTLRGEIKAILASYKDKVVNDNKGNKDNKDKTEAKARIKQIREQIAVLRAKIGNGGRVQSGIYTNWANENLKLNVKRGEPGWYRIIIVAKNRGTLPSNYDRFTFSVNNSGNETVAGISVKASDNVYHRGSADIKLDNPAGTTLNIVWTNDAYMKDKYDANVNIKKVVLKKIKEPKEKAVNAKHLNGDEFSFMDGRWFFENKAAHTFWANQIIGYTFKNLEEGEYEVTVTAKNFDSLPLEKNYKEFNVEIDSDYDSASMNIKADDKNWNHEKVTMNFAEGDTTLYINWTNDVYKENTYDSNIMIKTISIKKVQKSSLTAFLLRTKPGNKVFILGAFLMLSGLIFGLYLKNKNTSEA